MLPSARIRFELKTIRDRIDETRADYEKNKGVRQEHITDIVYDGRKKFVHIDFNTYRFEITYDNERECYLITWYHMTDAKEWKNREYLRDGEVECVDLARVIQKLLEYIYGAFSPVRAHWWQERPRPEGYSKNQRWA